MVIKALLQWLLVRGMTAPVRPCLRPPCLPPSCRRILVCFDNPMQLLHRASLWVDKSFFFFGEQHPALPGHGNHGTFVNIFPNNNICAHQNIWRAALFSNFLSKLQHCKVKVWRWTFESESESVKLRKSVSVKCDRVKVWKVCRHSVGNNEVGGLVASSGQRASLASAPPQKFYSKKKRRKEKVKFTQKITMKKVGCLPASSNESLWHRAAPPQKFYSANFLSKLLTRCCRCYVNISLYILWIYIINCNVIYRTKYITI